MRRAAVAGLCAAALLVALAGCRTAYPIDLECECDDLEIGYAIGEFFASQQECEEKADRDSVYAVALDFSQRFCNRWYRCVDPACPHKVVRAPGAAAACRCLEWNDGIHDGQWTMRCDLTRGDTECCCVPST